MESLQPHEKLDDLIRFGSISKVKQAMRRGKEVFIFLSHQWLAFDQPDPDNVHFTAMKQAVTAVAADAGVANAPPALALDGREEQPELSETKAVPDA